MKEIASGVKAAASAVIGNTGVQAANVVAGVAGGVKVMLDGVGSVGSIALIAVNIAVAILMAIKIHVETKKERFLIEKVRVEMGMIMAKRDLLTDDEKLLAPGE